MKTRLIALLTTGMMLASAAVLPPIQTGAAEDPILGTLPDWVPTDFADALQFYNNYGKTHVEDDFICLVRPAVQFMKDDYGVSLSGSMSELFSPAGNVPQFYELEIPPKPDKDDPDAQADYAALCEKLGIPSDDYSFFEHFQDRRTQPAFEVGVYRVFQGYDLTIQWTQTEGDETKVTETFSFENKDGTTVETDIYSWLPDSLPEFREFEMVSGKASAHGNAAQGVYVAYASTVNASTGASLKMEQEGDCEVKEVRRSVCAPVELLPGVDGAASHEVILYAPTADGIVDITWTVGREWSDEEPFEVTEGSFEFSYNCTVFTNRTIPKQPETIITLLDADTGEVIDFDNMNKGVCYIKEEIENDPYAGELFYMRTNPCSFKGTDAFDQKANYYVQLGGSSGWYFDPQFEITSQKEDRLEVSFRVKWYPSGDADGSGCFGLTDIVRLQKYLLGISKAEISDPDAVDFCRDYVLDVFDLALMKQMMFGKKQAGYVEPDVPVKFGAPFYVIADGLDLYAGPDVKSDVLTVIPRDQSVDEMGYQKDNNEWAFTQYRGISGWIHLVDEEGNPTVMYGAMVDKPVIYLYPTEETDVHVELTLTESELATTYPKYQDGWDVVASPDGSLLNKADGTHHRYLFWDSSNCRTRFDFSKGFCVAGADTESFLKEKLTYMGLTEEEMNEFIVYWLPRMEHNAFNLIAFQSDAYTNSAKLDITPAPDSELRVFMAYVPLDNAVEIEPQMLPTFERKGFSVVEWGGTEIAS